MLRYKICSITLFLFFVTFVASAQTKTNSISLKTLLNSAFKKAPELTTDSAAILISKAKATETSFNWLPNLKLNYQANIGSSNNLIGPYFGYGIIPSSTSGVHASNNLTASSTNIGIAALDWEIYNFGKYSAENRVANTQITVEQNYYAQSKYQIQAIVIANYLQLTRLQDLLAIQLQDIERNTEIMRSIRSLAKSGIKAGVDTSIAEAELSKARLNYIELNNQFKQVQLQLSAVSGVPYQSIIADSLLAPTLIQQPKAYLFQQDTINHPIINYYRSVYQNSLQNEDLVKKEFNPKIMFEAATWERGSSISSTDQYNNLSSGYGVQRGDYLLGFGISYNLFDIKRRQLKLSTQKANTDYAIKKLQEQKELLSYSANQADVEMETALSRLKEIPNQLRAANSSYRQQLSLYRNGLSNIVDLDAAVNILYRAETDYMQAKYDYTNALFQKAITENQVTTILNLLK